MHLKILYLLLFCTLFQLLCKAQGVPRNAVILEGAYRGKNFYIQNPHAANDSGFCTETITVNDKEISFDNSSAFEIRLDSLGLTWGDPLRIVIAHKDHCKPKVLNPVIDGPQLFDFKSITVSGDSLLKWTTGNEEGKSGFIVEQFCWNKWIKTGEVDSKGMAKENSYEFRLQLHTGENRFRVKKLVSSFRYQLSNSVTCTSSQKKITYTIDKTNKQILFSAPTRYELYDVQGNLLKADFGTMIDYSQLTPGDHFLNYDRFTEELNLSK